MRKTAVSGHTAEHPVRPQRRRGNIARAVAQVILLAGAGAVATFPMTAAAQVAEAAAHYQIAPGPLASVLNQFGRAAGIMLVFSTDLTQGINSAGVNGNRTPSAGLGDALAGSGLAAVRQSDGSYLIQREPPQQSRADSVQGALPMVSITAEAERSNSTEGTGSYATRSASIMKGVDSLREIPQSVSVVTREKIEDNNLQNLYDVMNSTPGITMFQGSMTTSRFMSRGFAVSNYRIDGGAASYVNDYMADWDMAFYDHIEVLRGADGLFGAAAEPGGSINFVRKKPTRELQVNASLQAGSWNYKRADLDVGGPINEAGTLRGRTVLAYEDKDFFYDNSGSRSKMAYGILEADLSKNTMLTFGATYLDRVASDQGYGLPASTTGTDLHLPRSLFLSGINDGIKLESLGLFGALQTKINEDWSVKLSLQYDKKSQRRYNYYFSGAVDAATGEGVSGEDNVQYEKWSNKSVDLALTGKFSAWGRQHDVVVGTAWQRFQQSSLLYLGDTAIVPSIYSFNPADYPEHVNPPLGNSYLLPTEQFGVYGSLRLHLADPLRLIVGGRLGSYKYSYTQSWFDSSGNVTDTSVTSYQDNRVFTPYVGVTYDLSKEWTAYASIAETFKSQASYLSAPGKPLDPVTGRNFELGVKGDHFGGRLQTAIALYETHREGAAVANGPIITYPNGSRCCYVGTGKIISQGIDAEISGEPIPGLQLSASYNYNYNRNRRSTESRYETLTPKSLFKTYAAYQLPGSLSRMKVGGGMQVQTKTYQKEDGLQVSQGGYSIWNLFGDYKLNDKWSLALNVNNLFDKRYYSTIGYYYYGNFYGSPRNVMLSLRGKL